MDPIKNNPLSEYFRSIKLYTKLPGGVTHNKDNIKFLDDDTVGVFPMTGKDELTLRNPDALLNGQALVDVIHSCVPAVKNPKILLANDIEALITAIRCATYNDGLETEISCPECKHKNTHMVDLQYVIDNMELLEDEYVVNLESGLSVYVKPYGYTELLKSLHSQFEQSKIERSVNSSEISDEQRLKIFSQAFTSVAKLTVELVVSSILRVTDHNTVNVNDKKHISEFVQNIDRNSINQIEDLIKEINSIGIQKKFNAQCEKCEHTWESEIDFNPVNFS